MLDGDEIDYNSQWWKLYLFYLPYLKKEEKIWFTHFLYLYVGNDFVLTYTLNIKNRI